MGTDMEENQAVPDRDETEATGVRASEQEMTLVRETEKALLLRCGSVERWVPKKLWKMVGDGNSWAKGVVDEKFAMSEEELALQRQEYQRAKEEERDGARAEPESSGDGGFPF